MKKKIVVLSLCVALLAVAIIGGTMAYFTDDEQITNTMVIGNVEINIEEYQMNDEGEYEDYVDNEFMLYPIENEQGNAFRNKVVHTFNTSTSESDAYIRTIVLFEKNDMLPEDYQGEGGNCCLPGMHFTYYGTHGCEEEWEHDRVIHSSKNYVMEGTVTINGNEYWVVVFEDETEHAIPYGEALASLLGVWMDKNITSELVEGWYGFDEEGEVTDTMIDIIAFSQGIQADGLTYDEAMEALGEVNADNVEDWIGADTGNVNDFASLND